MGLGDSDTMDEQERQALEAFKKFLQNSHLPRFPEYMTRTWQNIWASRFQGAGELHGVFPFRAKVEALWHLKRTV